jgi:hypothetical protein
VASHVPAVYASYCARRVCKKKKKKHTVHIRHVFTPFSNTFFGSLVKDGLLSGDTLLCVVVITLKQLFLCLRERHACNIARYTCHRTSTRILFVWRVFLLRRDGNPFPLCKATSYKDIGCSVPHFFLIKVAQRYASIGENSGTFFYFYYFSGMFFFVRSNAGTRISKLNCAKVNCSSPRCATLKEKQKGKGINI